MSQDRQRLSNDELDRLLGELTPAQAGSGQAGPSQSELDRTLADILGQPSGSSIFTPQAASQQEQPASPAPAQQPAAILGTAPARPAAVPPQKENIPQQERRPFVAPRLQLDDNPLVNEDFRRFFTTSVTPDALFSSKGDTQTDTAAQAAGRATRHTGLWQAVQHNVPHRKPEQADHADKVPPVEDKPAADAVARGDEKPARKGSLLQMIRDFFFEDEPDEARPDAADTEQPAGVMPPETPSEETAAPGVQHGPSTDTAIFEKQPAGAAAVPDSSATAIFTPVTGQEAAQQEETAAADTVEVPVQPAAAPDSAANVPAAAASAEPESPAQVSATAQAAAEEPDEDAPSAWEDDYDTPAQQPEVAATLRSMVVGYTWRAVVLALLAAGALYLSFAAAWLQPDAMGGPVVRLAVQMIALLVGGAVSIPLLRGGFAGLLGDASADSFAALSWAGALVQCFVLLVSTGSFDPARQVVFAGFALAALFAATLGKRVLAAGVQRNFHRLTSGQLSYAVASLVQDAGLVRRLTHGLGEAEPCLLVSRPTAFYRGFLHQSFGERRGDTAARPIARALPVAALAAGVLGILFDTGFFLPFTAVLCIASPLSMVLVSAVPGYFMNRSARAIGTILPGPGALEDLGQANVVVADARDLFPTGSVTLKGMKVFGEHRIDHAILYAASLLVSHCSTLKDVFLTIIQDRTELLFKVENLQQERGCGLDGWAEDKHLLVGNRGMMIAHGVEVPPADYEQRYTRDGRYCPVYLSVNGSLAAMFVVGYRPNAEVKELLDEVYTSGLSLLVTSDDFNLTGERINTVYGIPGGCIKVLGAAESERLGHLTSYCSRCEGVMVHASTSLRGFLAGIRIAARALEAEKAACTIQTVSVILTTLLVVILTCTGGLAGIGAAAVGLYQLAWLVLTLLLPIAKQY